MASKLPPGPSEPAPLATFLERGPGRVLSGLVRQIKPDVELTPADSVQKLEEFATART
jgi:hypothetical protein